MVRVASLCLLLLPLVQGTTIVGISTKDIKSQPPYEIDLVDPLTGNCVKVADGDALPPDDALLQQSQMLVYSTTTSSLDGSLTTVDLTTGKSQKGPVYPRLSFTNLAFDEVTNQTFVVVFNTTGVNTSQLCELLPDQSLRKMGDELPGIIYAGTYSSSKHVFFLVMGYGPFSSHCCP